MLKSIMSSRRPTYSLPRGFDNLLSPPEPFDLSGGQSPSNTSRSLLQPSVQAQDYRELHTRSSISSPLEQGSRQTYDSLLYSSYLELPPAPLPREPSFASESFQVEPNSGAGSRDPSALPENFGTGISTSELVPWLYRGGLLEAHQATLSYSDRSPSTESLESTSTTSTDTMSNIVDLTTSPTSEHRGGSSRQSTTLKRRASNDEESGSSRVPIKRSRGSPPSNLAIDPSLVDVEQVNLEDVDDDDSYDHWKSKQAAALVESQKPSLEDGPQKLATFQCIICLDRPTDLTVTHCGHLFCSLCLHEALNATITGKRNCPVCRQAITGSGKKSTYPLEMKLMTKSKGKQPLRAQ